MDVNLENLNVVYDPNADLLLLEVLNYISGGQPKVTAISLLRDGESLIRVISAFEKQTKWQSSQVIDLFFKYKNDAITGFQFINGWLDYYYGTTGLVMVTDAFRFASNEIVVTTALLVLNVLYIKRDSLTYDLKTRLEALWVDFGSAVDSIIVWMRTRAQLMDTNTGLHTCAHQLFSGHSLQEFQSIQQRLTQMVQQKLINDLMKKVNDKDILIKQQAKDFADLGTKMYPLVQELKELKNQNVILASEVKWQMSANKELNQTVAKLEHENQVLKKLALKNNSFLNDIINKSDSTTGATKDISIQLMDEPNNNTNSSQSNNGSNFDEPSSSSPVNSNGSDDKPESSKASAKQMNEITGNYERNEDTDSSTEIEDITDSGNHSDAATDDLLLEINQISPKSDDTANSSSNDVMTKNNDNNNNKNEIKECKSWEEFFANDSNNKHDLNDDEKQLQESVDHQKPESVQPNDTYNNNNNINKSNQSLGTNDNRISALIIN
ncbi:myb-like protein I [Oppia nitens]|uniref:myb-like protein I n=1 Tax=Oppia nitens TaxID=1686743 RepID=UPI0023DA13DF|nr:myb-like protein I [Oppia nitens]